MFKLAVAWVTGSIPRGEKTYPNHMDLEWGREIHKQKLRPLLEKKKKKVETRWW